jgi:hypothetical protein
MTNRQRTKAADAAEGVGVLPAPKPGMPVPIPAAGQAARVGADGLAVERSAEIRPAGSAAQAEAAIKAMFAMAAMLPPRSENEARRRLLDACARPAFAAKSRYAVPRAGKTITGWSIRFAEAAIRAWGKIDVLATVVSEDGDKRVLNIRVIDLERVVSFGVDAVVHKTVERRTVPEGVVPLGERLNSTGEIVYLLPAREDDLVMKTAAIVSKALRTCGLRHIPQDILDECADAVRQAADGGDDREAQIRKVVDAFAGLGVRVADLARYLGQPVESVTPTQINDLRGLWTALEEGTTTWAAIMQERDGGSKAQPAPATGTLDVAAMKAGTAPPKPGSAKPGTPTGAAEKPAPAPAREPGDDDLDDFGDPKK